VTSQWHNALMHTMRGTTRFQKLDHIKFGLPFPRKLVQNLFHFVWALVLVRDLCCSSRQSEPTMPPIRELSHGLGRSEVHGVAEETAAQLQDSSYLLSDGTPQYIVDIKKWLGACAELHGDVCVAKPIRQRPQNEVPLWLIDTHQGCIVPGLSADKYLAPSYVWPESRTSSSPKPHTLLLDTKSASDFARPGFLDEIVAQRIPTVIRHAMELTRLLGERYLWVDRVCIIQDDFGDGGTFSQVASMDKIYAGAHLTIIAAADDDHYEQKTRHRWDMFKTQLYQAYHVSVGGRIDEESETQPRNHRQHRQLNEDELAEIMSLRYAELMKSKWATRGWTYQEQILCKRAAVFTNTGLFWDCQRSFWDGVDIYLNQIFSSDTLRADLGRTFSERWWPDFGLYIDISVPTMVESSRIHRMPC